MDHRSRSASLPEFLTRFVQIESLTDLEPIIRGSYFCGVQDPNHSFNCMQLLSCQAQVDTILIWFTGNICVSKKYEKSCFLFQSFLEQYCLREGFKKMKFSRFCGWVGLKNPLDIRHTGTPQLILRTFINLNKTDYKSPTCMHDILGILRTSRINLLGCQDLQLIS